MDTGTRDEALWQATYDARLKYFENALGPLPADILKMLNMMGIWPGGGMFVIPAHRVTEMLTVYTTFGLTNADMPTSVQMQNFESLPAAGRRQAGGQFTLVQKTPAAKRAGAAGYGYEICVVAEPNQQWALNFLQWAVVAEIGNDVGLLGRVEQYGGLTVGELRLGGPTPIDVLIAKGRPPWPVGTDLPNGKMEVLIATLINTDELQWSMQHGREALLERLGQAHVGQISLLGRPSVVGD